MADSAGFDKNLPIVKTNPDPTEAVKEALTLAIKNLSEKIFNQFGANEKAVVLAREELATTLASMITTIDGKFAANKDLVDQLAKANAVALTAALSTQKESAAKSEVAIGDMIKQLQTAQDAANKTTNEKIDRLTSRMDTGEGRGFGNVESKHDRSTDKGQMLTIIIAVIALAALVISALPHFK
jgi:hypothetical protein